MFKSVFKRWDVIHTLMTLEKIIIVWDFREEKYIWDKIEIDPPIKNKKHHLEAGEYL